MNKNREIEIGEEEFLELPTEEIRRIVNKKGTPKSGIFIADGNRRLVMCRSRLSPTSEEFYKEYARFFVDSLQQSLSIFFDHGLKILFFPLFGPSLLLRKNKFQSITIPAAYRDIFQSDEWFRFYEEKDIRVKAYGDLSQLKKIDIEHLNMAEGIRQAEEKTAGHDKHTVFFGFMSDNTPGMEMPQQIIDFYKQHNRAPSLDEMITSYYGEKIPEADFYIFSDKISIRALPPLVPSKNTQAYLFPAPGFLGLNMNNFRRIIHDLLYFQNANSYPEYEENNLKEIDELNNYYRLQSKNIIGLRTKTGGFLTPKLVK